jgi:hypothetical protein
MPEIPDFTNPRWHEKRHNYELLISIINGRGRRMPSFVDYFGTPQARALVDHVRAIGGVKRKDDGDFEKCFRMLQQEWQELRKQYWELSPLR